LIVAHEEILNKKNWIGGKINLAFYFNWGFYSCSRATIIGWVFLFGWVFEKILKNFYLSIFLMINYQQHSSDSLK